MSGRPPLTSLVVAAALAGAVLVGCGGTPTPTRARVAAALQTSGLPAAEARCATDRLFADLTPAELRAIATRGASAIPSNKSSTVSSDLSRCATAHAAPGPGTLPPNLATVPTTTGGAGLSTSVAPTTVAASSSTVPPAGSGSTRPIPASTGRAR